MRDRRCESRSLTYYNSNLLSPLNYKVICVMILVQGLLKLYWNTGRNTIKESFKPTPSGWLGRHECKTPYHLKLDDIVSQRSETLFRSYSTLSHRPHKIISMSSYTSSFSNPQWTTVRIILCTYWGRKPYV